MMFFKHRSSKGKLGPAPFPTGDGNLDFRGVGIPSAVVSSWLDVASMYGSVVSSTIVRDKGWLGQFLPLQSTFVDCVLGRW